MLSRAAMLSLLGMVFCTPAKAHGGLWVGPHELALAWTPDPWVVAPMLLAWLLYGRGLARLWGRAGIGRGIAAGRAAAFALGMAALGLALVWPLDALGETLFAAHMVQHMILLVLAPPLLIVGRPEAVWTAGLPESGRRRIVRTLRRPARWAGALARPWPATLFKALVLWLWHAPLAFEAALGDPAIHTLEHACFMVAGLAFWWALLHPDRASALALPSAALASLVTLVHGGLLGALIALAPEPVYGWYAGRGEPWGLSQMQDQQLAGLAMWIPAGFAYLAAGVFGIGVWLRGLERQALRVANATRPGGPAS